MAIQATVAKQAAANGLALIETEGRVEARKGEHIVAWATPGKGAAKEALKKALVVIEGDRLRGVDPRPEDREPILVLEGKMPSFVREIEEVVHSDESIADTKALMHKAIKVIKGNIIKSKYRERYKKNGDYSCGDDLAGELRAYTAEVKNGQMRVNPAKIKEVALANGVWKETYAKLNVGQQRMTVGNCLRHKYALGDRIDIGGVVLFKEFKDL